MNPLSLAASDYFRRNFAVTTSGFESPDVLDIGIQVGAADLHLQCHVTAAAPRGNKNVGLLGAEGSRERELDLLRDAGPR